MKVQVFLKSRLEAEFPKRQLKMNLLCSFRFSMRVPEKLGNYKMGLYFSPLCVCINVEHSPVSVLHVPQCSMNMLYGHCVRGFLHAKPFFTASGQHISSA